LAPLKNFFGSNFANVAAKSLGIGRPLSSPGPGDVEFDAGVVAAGRRAGCCPPSGPWVGDSATISVSGRPMPPPRWPLLP